MGGSYVHVPPTQHVCDLPTCDDRIGVVWRCDECGRYWQRKEVHVGYGCQVMWRNSFWRNVGAKLRLRTT